MPWMPRPALVALAAVALATIAATTGCASMTRERCASESAPAAGTYGDAALEPLTERDQQLVKRLVRALHTDDFAGFERLQPTESQYLTLSWRFGAAQADALMGFVRDREGARAHFDELRRALADRGLDARTATRCARRYATRPDEPRLYTIDVAFGDGASALHLSAEVFDSSGHASFVGRVMRPATATPRVED